MDTATVYKSKRAAEVSFVSIFPRLVDAGPKGFSRQSIFLREILHEPDPILSAGPALLRHLPNRIPVLASCKLNDMSCPVLRLPADPMNLTSMFFSQ